MACGPLLKLKTMGFKLTKDEFVEKVKQSSNGKIEFIDEAYRGTRQKHKFRCKHCGHEWYMRADDAMAGRRGCPECAINRCRDTMEDFVSKFRERFPDSAYDFSQAEYRNSKTKIKVICPDHGAFWIPPYDLLRGHGCPICKMSGLEHEVMISLKNSGIRFDRQKKFKWLGKQSIDFYLPEIKVALECQGRQHFIGVPHFGGQDKLERTQCLDNRKKELCGKHGINVVYFVERNNTIYMEPGDLFFVDTECMTGYFQAIKASLKRKRTPMGSLYHHKENDLT